MGKNEESIELPHGMEKSERYRTRGNTRGNMRGNSEGSIELSPYGTARTGPKCES